MQEDTISSNSPDPEENYGVSQDLVGKTIGGFKIEREIGRGAMGFVYEAYQQDLHRKVALKILSPQLANDEMFVKRFQIEAKSAAKIHHNNIATIFAFGEDHSIYYYAMEFVDGLTLDGYITEKKPKLSEKLTLISHIAKALQYAHEHGIIHRDIKSQNIMVDSENRVVITDFGLAKIEEATIMTIDGTIMGTPSYMSPEQVHSNQEQVVDQRTDIYSLGIVFYEIVTGTLPFKGDSHLSVMKKLVDTEPIAPQNIVKHLPKDIDTIILKAIEKDPIHRYQTCLELAQDIECFLNGEPILAKPTGIIKKSLKKIKKHRKLFIILLLLLSFTICGWLYLFITNLQEKKQHQKILENANKELQTTKQEKHILLTRLSDDPLFRVLEDPDPFVRKNALIALNKKVRGKKIIGTMAEKSFNMTIRALNDENPQVRLYAAGLLGLIEDTRAISPLMNHLQDPDKEVQKYVILALGWIRSPQATNQLLEKLHDKDPKIRMRSILSLALIKDPIAVPPLIEMLKDSDPVVKNSAIEALSNFKDERAIAPLLELLNDPQQSIRKLATDGLAQFSEASRLPVIIWVLKNPNSTKENILQAIESLNAEKDEKAIPYLLGLLSSKETEIRIYAASFLGLFQKITTIYPLIQLLDDPEPKVRESAYFSLIGITLESFGPEKDKWEDWWKKQETKKEEKHD
ncbi:HEAT repeat domain-containing protein [Chlamydiota bacterium]